MWIEHRLGVAVANGVGRSREGEGRDDHPIARCDAGDEQCQMETRGSATEGDGMIDADALGELPLERREVGSGRSNPVRVERGEQQFALGGAHVGW